MTVQQLTDDQRCLLTDWEDLTEKDRKAINKLLQHLLRISLELRSRRAWMEKAGVEDYSQAA